MNLAVGFFDGVHVGHQRILAHADAALTFTNHPATVFAPDRAPRLLMTTEERLAAISVQGVRRVIARDFTPALAAQPPQAFADSLRRDFPDLDEVFCGPNWTFGAGGAGTADLLRALGFQVTVVPFATWRREPVSSTRIRAALGEGDVAAAAAMLGRPYSASGRVVGGKGEGRALGFPTLNIVPSLGDLPLVHGVYALRRRSDAASRTGAWHPRWARAPGPSLCSRCICSTRRPRRPPPRCGWLSRHSSAQSAPLNPSPTYARKSPATNSPSQREGRSLLRPLVGRGLRTRRMGSRHLGGARPRTSPELMACALARRFPRARRMAAQTRDDRRATVATDMRHATGATDMRHATVASRKVVMSLAHVARRMSHVPPEKTPNPHPSRKSRECRNLLRPHGEPPSGRRMIANTAQTPPRAISKSAFPA